MTGAGGALGGHLANLLHREGYDVFATLRPGAGSVLRLAEGVHVVACDLNDPSQVKSTVSVAEPTQIVHCAGARSTGSLSRLLLSNVLALGNLLDSLHNPTVRLVVIGSSAEYGSGTPDTAVNEDNPLKPGSAYGLSKMLQFQLTEFASQAGIRVVYARPFNMVGPAVSPETALGDWACRIAAIVRGEAAPLLEVGNPDLWRDFTDVRDVASACLTLLTHGQTDLAYNVCSGASVRLGDALQLLIEIAGVPIEVQTVGAPATVRRQTGDPSRLRALGWVPRIGLASSLRDALDSWLKQPLTRGVG